MWAVSAVAALVVMPGDGGMGAGPCINPAMGDSRTSPLGSVMMRKK
jgi:hypothetical protein